MRYWYLTVLRNINEKSLSRFSLTQAFLIQLIPKMLRLTGVEPVTPDSPIILFVLVSSLAIRRYYCVLRLRPNQNSSKWQVKEFVSPPFFVLRSHEFAGIRGISKMSANQAGKVGYPNRNGFDSRQPKYGALN